MDFFVARQPILDADLRTFGHELLYRSGPNNFYTGTDDTLASLEVIHNSLFSLDIAQIAGGRRVFINFTRDLLLGEAAQVLPPKEVVIEVLEDALIDADLLASCRRLRERGYLLAADDVASCGQTAPLLDLVDFIKVDFRVASPEEQKKIVQTHGKRHVCLAEKLETRAEYEIARKLGYRLFQGYFFARPAILTGRQIPGYKMNYLRILDAVHRPELEFAELEKLIRQDPSVAHKLLRYANSALFGQCMQIDSIMRAMVILGEQELRKWTSIVLLMHLASGKPDALVMCALIRANFCESIAQRAGLGSRKSELFLMGMFSLLDAMTDAPLRESLGQIRLPADVQATLLGEKTLCFPLADVYQLLRAYERGDWQAVMDHARRLRVQAQEVREAYLRAVSWCEEVFRLVPREGVSNPPVGNTLDFGRATWNYHPVS